MVDAPGTRCWATSLVESSKTDVLPWLQSRGLMVFAGVMGSNPIRSIPVLKDLDPERPKRTRALRAISLPFPDAHVSGAKSFELF